MRRFIGVAVALLVATTAGALPGQSLPPGTYPYHCTPHPFMKGVIVVK
jgi:plastocyanin